MPLNPVARAAIEELRGMGVTNLTPDEIVHLNDLGAAQMRAGRAEGGVPLLPPVRAGNAVLHPLTCAAADFIERWSDDESVSRAAWIVPFAFAHGRTPETFAALMTSSDVRNAIDAWRRRLNITENELAHAMESLLRRDDAGKTDAANSLLAFTAYAEIFDAESARCIRELGDAVMAKIRKAEEKTASAENDATCDNEREFDDSFYWRKVSVDLAVMTGVSPDYWYAQSRDLAIYALRRAHAVEDARNGTGGGQRASGDVVRAIAAVRAEIVRIAETRKAAG